MKSSCPTNFSKSPNLAYHVNQLCILIIVLAQLKKERLFDFIWYCGVIVLKKIFFFFKLMFLDYFDVLILKINLKNKKILF